MARCCPTYIGYSETSTAYQSAQRSTRTPTSSTRIGELENAQSSYELAVAWPRRQRLRDRRGAVGLMVAASLVPLSMSVGLAVDYSFYVPLEPRLILPQMRPRCTPYALPRRYIAAVASIPVRTARAAMAAITARVATARPTTERAMTGRESSTDCGVQAGTTAGVQWFQAQIGTLANAIVTPNNVAVNVVYTAAPSSFTATVSYTGMVPTHFGKLFQRASCRSAAPPARSSVTPMSKY